MGKRQQIQHQASPAAVFTIMEAADYLRVSKTTVYRLFNEKNLQRVRLGGRTLVRKADADALLARCLAAE
jgi:excisionase family DNA binding protein